MAHFPRSLRCGDPVRLQSYFCRASVVGSMPADDPNRSSPRGLRCDAAIASREGVEIEWRAGEPTKCIKVSCSAWHGENARGDVNARPLRRP